MTLVPTYPLKITLLDASLQNQIKLPTGYLKGFVSEGQTESQ